MNVIDIGVLALILLNLVIGTVRGAIWQVLRIASIVLGVTAAGRYDEEFLARWPKGLGDLNAQQYGIVVAWIVIFMSVYLVMFGLTHLIRAFVDKVKLGGYDRLVGAVLGAAKGAAISALILTLQFLPIVSSTELVRTQLEGTEDGSVPPSIANNLYTEYLHERLKAALPADEAEESKEKILARLKEQLSPAAYETVRALLESRTATETVDTVPADAALSRVAKVLPPDVEGREDLLRQIELYLEQSRR